MSARHSPLDAFFQAVQSRAFVTAKLAVSNEDDALDIVQESMLKMVKSYRDTDPELWGGLFQRILQNTIRDWYRRQKVRKVMFWWQQHEVSEEELDIDEGSTQQSTPVQSLADTQYKKHILTALKKLPKRQQQAFVLRAWWEHNTEETAEIMGCSQGSVKTHFSRALSALQDQLAHLGSDL
ncbi:RNA polymerase sigma factor [Sessilibacter sp. MAH4]